MKKVLIFLPLLLIVFSGAVSGFDGNRGGFVLGGGLGFAPVSKWSVDFFGLNVGSFEDEQPAFALHLFIGAAFSDHNMLVYEINGTGFSTDVEGISFSVSQGFSGAVWYHYFGQPGKSMFTALGLGLWIFQIEDYDAANPGGALMLGGGYEFARHWQVGAYLSFGKTSDYAYGIDAEFEHSQLSFLVSGAAF
jgi:hypothetical protein